MAELSQEDRQKVIDHWDKLTPERQKIATERFGITPPAPSTPPAATPQATPEPAWKVSLTDPAPTPAVATAPAPAPERLRIPPNLDEDVAREAQAFSNFLEPHHLLKMGAALGINVLGTGAGATLGAATGPFAGAGIPLGAAAGSYAAREVNKRLGLEEPGLGGDVMALAAPLVPSAWNAAKNTVKTAARYSPAGRAIRTADEATATAQARYGEKLLEAKTAATQATGEAQRAYDLKQAGAYETALEKAKDAQATYRRATQDYLGAQQAQKQAATTAQALPSTFAPEVEAQKLYATFAETYGSRTASLVPASAAADRVLTQLGGHFEAMQPSRMQAIATEIAATGEAPVAQIHQYLKDLGPLTRSSDGRIRGAAKQLYAGLQDALETVPGAPKGLREANAAARKEFAIEDLERLVRRAVHVGNDGFTRLDSGRLVTQLSRLGEEDALFRGSFTKDEWERLMGNVDALTGQPQIPSRAPTVPGSIAVKSLGERPGDIAPKPVTPPTPVEPVMKPPRLKTWATALGIPMAEELMRGHVGPYAAVGLAVAAADSTAYGLSRLFLQPNMQPVLRRLIQPGGHVDPRVTTYFTAAARAPWALPGNDTTHDTSIPGTQRGR